MSTEALDVPLLLARRKHKHILLRGVAQVIDLVVLVVASNVLVTLLGEAVVWIVFPAMFLYFVLMETLVGFTLGKRICELRVVGPDGTNPSFSQSLVRNIVRPIEAIGFIPLGIIVAASTQRGQRIGDLVASTFVVRVNELPDLSARLSDITSNDSESSREIIPLTDAARQVAAKRIADSDNPRETVLTVTEDSTEPHGLSVQFDLLDTGDDSWYWTNDGVTISVPRHLADRCDGLMIGVTDGRLVVDSAT